MSSLLFHNDDQSAAVIWRDCESRDAMRLLCKEDGVDGLPMAVDLSPATALRLARAIIERFEPKVEAIPATLPVVPTFKPMPLDWIQTGDMKWKAMSLHQFHSYEIKRKGGTFTAFHYENNVSNVRGVATETRLDLAKAHCQSIEDRLNQPPKGKETV